MLARYMQSLVRGLTTLAFEESCLVCGAGDQALCLRCNENWSGEPKEIMGESFPIFSQAIYDDLAAKIVLSAKESGFGSAKEILSLALTKSVLALLRRSEVKEGRIDLVPIPSSRRAQIRRGEDFLFELAKLTKIRLAKAAPGFDFRISRVLKVRKLIRDQSGLSERERDLNLSGAFYADLKIPITTQLVILDDVVTTGSTLREANRALKERNLTALGAATACASQRRLLIR